MDQGFDYSGKFTSKEGIWVFILAALMPSKRRGYLLGGTMQLIGGNTAGRHPKSGGDKYGSYTWMKFGRKNDSKLCVITLYCIIQDRRMAPSHHLQTATHHIGNKSRPSSTMERSIPTLKIKFYMTSQLLLLSSRRMVTK